MAGMLRIGVELPADLADVGELLADARAFDAAGADSLWVRGDGPVDQVVLLAAVSAVTFRARIACASFGGDGRARSSLEKLSRGRFVVLAAHRGNDPEAGRRVFERARAAGEATERWASLDRPRDRAHWRAQRTAWAAAGATGLVIPAGPGALDLVRNPEQDDDRSDLLISVG